jgi:hypothetical protein
MAYQARNYRNNVTLSSNRPILFYQLSLFKQPVFDNLFAFVAFAFLSAVRQHDFADPSFLGL